MKVLFFILSGALELANSQSFKKSAPGQNLESAPETGQNQWISTQAKPSCVDDFKRRVFPTLFAELIEAVETAAQTLIAVYLFRRFNTWYSTGNQLDVSLNYFTYCKQSISPLVINDIFHYFPGCVFKTKRLSSGITFHLRCLVIEPFLTGVAVFSGPFFPSLLKMPPFPSQCQRFCKRSHWYRTRKAPLSSYLVRNWTHLFHLVLVFPTKREVVAVVWLQHQNQMKLIYTDTAGLLSFCGKESGLMLHPRHTWRLTKEEFQSQVSSVVQVVICLHFRGSCLGISLHQTKAALQVSGADPSVLSTDAPPLYSQLFFWIDLSHLLPTCHKNRNWTCSGGNDWSEGLSWDFRVLPARIIFYKQFLWGFPWSGQNWNEIWLFSTLCVSTGVQQTGDVFVVRVLCDRVSEPRRSISSNWALLTASGAAFRWALVTAGVLGPLRIQISCNKVQSYVNFSFLSF